MYKFRENIEAIAPYIPGKPVKEVERELGIKGSIKLASNENPWGFSPKAKAAMEHAIKEANTYPDGGSFYLKQKIAKFNNVEMENIIVGNGSNEVLEDVLRTMLGEHINVVCSQYAFTLYRIIAQTCGATFTTTPAKNYAADVYSMMDACNEKTAAVIVDNPNNPTGTYVPFNQMVDLVNFCEKNKILLMADEAYWEYTRAKDYKSMMSVWGKYEHLVVTRTFSKTYGLCGLRIGYGVGNKHLIELANKVREPFNVNLIAQYAGEAALEDQDFVQQTVVKTHEGIDFLYKELKELGLTYIPTEASFVLIEVPFNGRDFFNKLLHYGIIVKPVANYGLKNFIRLSVGTMQHNKKAIAAIKGVLQDEK